MADGANVRVVRCPKCGKLLPEPPNTPVYRCGGCNATLQAKKHMYARSDVSSEKSDEEKVGADKIPDNSSEKGKIDSNEVLETNRESDGVEFRRKERVLPERMLNPNVNSSARSATKEILNDFSDSRRFESRAYGYEQSRYRRPSKVPVENWGMARDLGYSDGLVTQYAEADGLAKAQIENTAGFQRFRQIPEPGVSGRTTRAVAEDVRFSPYSNEGAPNYHLNYAYGYYEQIMNRIRPGGSDKVESLEQDRKELLRQLDELRDRLSLTSDASGQSKERFLPTGRRTVPLSPYNGRNMFPGEGSSTANRGSGMQTPPQFNNDPVPLMNRHDLDMHKFYHPMRIQNEILGYREPLAPPRMRRGASHHAHHYPQRPSNSYLAGKYSDIQRDPVIPFPQNSSYNQPNCSCVHCYNSHWSVARQVPPAILHNQRLVNAAESDMFYHLDGHIPPVLGDSNLRGASFPLNSHEVQSHARIPSDVESDMGGFTRTPPHRTVLPKGKGRSCQPLAGGAPFLTCCYCFELLEFPKRLLMIDKDQHKLRCGACSKVILYKHDGKRLIFFMPASTQMPPVEANNPSPTQRAQLESNKPSQTQQAQVNGMKESLTSNDQRTIDCHSDDSYDSSCAIQSTATKPVLSPPCSSVSDGAAGTKYLLNSSQVHKMQQLSLSSISSDDEDSPNSVTAPKDVPKFTVLPLKVDRVSSVPGSPRSEHFEYSPTNEEVSKLWKGSRSQRSDKEKIFPVKGGSRQNTFKDASAATETECSFNEYPNSGISQDSEEVSKGEARPRFGKGGESFFAGLVKKSFREFGRSNQSLENETPSVSVNGQPLPDQLVKKAEMRAGPIRPGQYWYDYRAGFWGVVGFPCLGIIPPYIEEFDQPMPKNCSGGNTGILVNGRELHQKDMELLASRGLPITANKSYVIEISGRVFDEASGEELESLGKLAPTVQRANHGFGMRVPRSMQ